MVFTDPYSPSIHRCPLVQRRCLIRQKDRLGGRESARPMFHRNRNIFPRNLTNAPDNQGMQSASQTDASSSQITRHTTKRQAALQRVAFISGGCYALVMTYVLDEVLGTCLSVCLSLYRFVGMSLT